MRWLQWPILLLAVIGLVLAVLALGGAVAGLTVVAVTAQVTVLLNQCVTALLVVGGSSSLGALLVLRNRSARYIIKTAIARKLNVELPDSTPAYTRAQLRKPASPTIINNDTSRASTGNNDFVVVVVNDELSDWGFKK